MEDDNRKLYPMLMLPVDPKRSGDERYTLADLGAVDTMVDNGWLGGNSMGEIMETYLDRVSGENPFEFYGTQFPVLVKTIKTEETTPVRVNVGDEEAEQRYDSFGKTALWYISSAAQGAKVYMGFKDDISAAELYQRCLMGDVLSLLNEIEPAEGDAFLIPPGTAYAAGPGLDIIEISEASELSLRLSGEDSRQEMEEVFDLVDMKAWDPSNHIHSTDVARPAGDLAAVPQFHAARIVLDEALHIFSRDCFSVYHCVKGKVSVQVPEGDAMKGYELPAGRSMLVPDDVDEFYLVPSEKGSILLEAYMDHRSETDTYLSKQ